MKLLENKRAVLNIYDRWAVVRYLPFPCLGGVIVRVEDGTDPAYIVEQRGKQKREKVVTVHLKEFPEPSIMWYCGAIDVRPYQLKASEFASFDDLLYPFLGLAEEAGEVIGKIAKALRGDYPLLSNKDDIIKELGDVCWMLAMCCSAMGMDIERVMKKNIEKLTDRQSRGVIKGDGDNR